MNESREIQTWILDTRSCVLHHVLPATILWKRQRNLHIEFLHLKYLAENRDQTCELDSYGYGYGDDNVEL